MLRSVRNVGGLVLVASLSVPAIAAAQRYTGMSQIDAGTVLRVRASEDINVSRGDGQIFRGVVDEDVRDTDGQVAILKGSTVELMARATDGDNLVLDLDSVTVAGRRFALRGSAEPAKASGGLGANKRTATYVGGGALLGTIIGGIAGGGKGAAIGAATGAAAGAGTQVLTKGSALKVPSGSVVTFELTEPLDVGIADSGYSRSGRHYHRYGRDDR